MQICNALRRSCTAAECPARRTPYRAHADDDRANATNYGLGASVWSSDTARAHKMASQIEAATVWINKHLDMAPHIPFGGAKQSGIGTEFAACASAA